MLVLSFEYRKGSEVEGYYISIGRCFSRFVLDFFALFSLDGGTSWISSSVKLGSMDGNNERLKPL